MESLRIERLTVCKTGDEGCRLVDDISFEIPPGEITAILGVSGSGKSLTCSGIMDVMPPGVDKRSGRVFHGERSVDMKESRGRLLSIIMQNPSNAFNPLYTMEQHVMEVMKVRGSSYKSRKAEVFSTMMEAGLDDAERVLKLYPFQMSGGMLQRMMIALALLSGSSFLIADEPTTDLDLIVQQSILNVLKDIARKKKMGILLVTHDLGVIAKIADRVLTMDKGRIVEAAFTEELFRNPQHRTSRNILNTHFSLYKGYANE